MAGASSYSEQVRRECTSFPFWRDVMAEFLGTMLLMSAQAALPLSWEGTKLGNVVQVALGMGFVVCALATALGPFGGAHFNPAVTVSMTVCAKITILRGILYVLVQCLGALVGEALIFSVVPEVHRGNLATTQLHPDVTVIQGCVLEAWATFILVLVVHGATSGGDGEGTAAGSVMPPLPIGLAVSLGIMCTFVSTGGSMNPARSLGPAVVMGVWTHHWVYWVGPLTGGCLAAAAYQLLAWRGCGWQKEHGEKSDSKTRFAVSTAVGDVSSWESYSTRQRKITQDQDGAKETVANSSAIDTKF